MSKFHPFVVTDIQKTIRDAVVLTLASKNAEYFNFTQGQYLTFRKDFDGVELRRSYSICAGKNTGLLQVGVKRVDGGTFSTWANTQLSIGDTLEAMPPMGNFFQQAANDEPHYLAFAAGSGITPVLSILRTALVSEHKARFTLVYANRNPNTIMFREELEDLKNDHIERLNIIHLLDEDSQDIELFKGPINAEKCDALLNQWIDIATVLTAYICGPEVMMKTMAQSLEKQGLDKNNIRFELFASSQPRRAKLPTKSAAIPKEGVNGQVIIGGESRLISIPAKTSGYHHLLSFFVLFCGSLRLKSNGGFFV